MSLFDKNYDHSKSGLYEYFKIKPIPRSRFSAENWLATFPEKDTHWKRICLLIFTLISVIVTQFPDKAH